MNWRKSPSFKSLILLVEDNEDHAELAAKALRNHIPEIEVEVAKTGGEGLARVGGGRYDLSILDYQLPDGDGVFWLERFLEREPNLPVVMVTGRGSEGVAAEAFRKGAWDYVVKSIDYVDLLPRAVERSLEKARLMGEKRRQEAEITDLKQFNEKIVSALPLCLLVLDRELRVIFSNRGDCNPWGGSCCEKGCHLKGVFYPLGRKDLGQLLREARKVLRTRKPAELPEVRWTSEEGERVLRVQITPMPGGKDATLLLILEDITLKKEMEQQVVEAKNKLEAILGAITDAIVVVDRDFIIHEINQQLVHMVDKPSSDLIGRYCYREFCRRKEVCLGCPTRRVFENGLPASAIIPAFRSDGSPIEISISAYPLKDGRGEVVRVVEYVREVTEERRRMRQVEQTRRMSALGEMVAGIAHEVKNPLQNIRLGLDLLKGELDSEGSLACVLQGIEQGMKIVDSIVEDLLDYSRPMQLHLAPWDLRQVVEEALSGSELSLEARGIRVVRDWGEGPFESLVDGMRLGQVLANLFSNALEAMQLGGDLRVSLSRQAYQGEEWLSVEVADTGCGIPSQNLERIFDPFFTTKGSGVGLGLAITHRIVELHQGHIDVHSQVGQGTTFTVLLPLNGR